jgi:hypothetical protein
MPRLRQNARRTWPDGSGCQQRPLHPCQDTCRVKGGCWGWHWGYGDRDGEVVITRCLKCRTFDDHADAAEHVAGCRTCQQGLRRLVRGDLRADVYVEPEGGELPPYSQRKGWAAWANRNAFPGRGLPPGRLSATSGQRALYEWLSRMDPNGDYRDLGEAELWEQLGHYADNYPEDED